MTVLFLAWLGPAEAADPVYPDCDPTRGNQPCLIREDSEVAPDATDDDAEPPTATGDEVTDLFDPRVVPVPWRPWASTDWLLPAGSDPLGGPRAARPLRVYDTYPFRPRPTSDDHERANPLRDSELAPWPTVDVFTGPAPIPPYP